MFTNPSVGQLSIQEVAKEIAQYIEERPNQFYRVVVGTDSQTKKSNGVDEIDFVNAIIVHRKGLGARYFWKKTKIIKKAILRDKIYTETSMSLQLASEFVPLLRSLVSSTKYDFEIHIDVGPLGPTRDMIKEVTGMVQGSGYTAKTKPDSWGASSVADKHT